jgi:hypothetical protein
VAAVRHHAGFGRNNQHGVVLSDPDDWKKTPNLDWSTPWSQILTEGRVVWVRNHYLTEVVHTDANPHAMSCDGTIPTTVGQ